MLGFGAGDRLNPTDATLWEIKRDPILRTTIVAVALLDRSPDWARLQSTVVRSVEALPRLRQRVHDGPLGFGRPLWVDAHPEMAFHLRRVKAPTTGSLRDVLDIGGVLASQEFDALRPMWEIELVDGLAHGRAALLLKVSHALTDGIGGVALLRAFDDRSGPTALAELQTAQLHHETPTLEFLAGVVRTPVDLFSIALGAGLHPFQTIGSVVGLAGSAVRLLSPAGPPLSSLMIDRCVDRWLGATDVSLEAFHRAAQRAGGTINDAFVTIAIAALADHHRRFGADDRRFRITMPVSFRAPDDIVAGNQWTPARVVLDVHPNRHPYDQLRRHRSRLRSAAHEPAIGISQRLAAALQQLPSALTVGIVAGMVKGCDAALTDVPGMQDPLTIAGASVHRLYPFAPAGGAALNIGLMSHVESACVGFNVDRAAVPEPAELVARFDERLHDFLRRRRRRATAEVEDSEAAGPFVAERLSALDTSFLRMESERTPMHMGGLFVIDGRSLFADDGTFDIEAVRRHVAERIAAAPRLHKAVKETQFELARPRCVDVDGLDINHHVEHLQLPSPGSREQLLEACEEVQMRRLSRDRPLFSFTFITGLDPVEFGTGAVALVERIHHALLDGVSGVELLAVLFDPTREPGPSPATEQPEPASGRPGRSQRTVASALAEQLHEPVEIVRLGLDAIRHPRRTADRIQAVAGALDDAASSFGGGTSSLHTPVGRHRRLLPLTFDLGAAHATANALGGTVNDLVLTALTEGLRALVAERGEPTDRAFHALVPVSTRQAGMDAQSGNKVAALLVELPVNVSEPAAAFAAVRDQMVILKTEHHAEGVELLLDAGNHLPAVAVDLISWITRRQPFADLVATNLPGPPLPLYFRGCPITEMVPIVPLGFNLTVSAAILSYAGELVVALRADPDACPDLDIFAEAIIGAMEQLMASAAA